MKTRNYGYKSVFPFNIMIGLPILFMSFIMGILKKDTGKKWDWKIFWIVVLIVLWISSSYEAIQLESSYNELLLNVTQMAGEFDSNNDCYERGTVQCYDRRMYCYDEIQISHTCEKGYSLGCIRN